MDVVQKEHMDLISMGTKFELLKSFYQKHLLTEEILSCMLDVENQRLFVRNIDPDGIDEYLDDYVDEEEERSGYLLHESKSGLSYEQSEGVLKDEEDDDSSEE